MWEDFENEDEEFELQDDDQEYDDNLHKEIRNRLGEGRKLSGNEIFSELSKFISLFQNAEKKIRNDWYIKFCEAMQRGDKKYFVEVRDISLLDAAQEVATEGPNGSSYKEWLGEFAMREDGGYSEIEFFKVLDTMGYFKDQMDLIENPQDILDL